MKTQISLQLLAALPSAMVNPDAKSTLAQRSVVARRKLDEMIGDTSQRALRRLEGEYFPPWFYDADGNFVPDAEASPGE